MHHVTIPSVWDPHIRLLLLLLHHHLPLTRSLETRSHLTFSPPGLRGALWVAIWRPPFLPASRQAEISISLHGRAAPVHMFSAVLASGPRIPHISLINLLRTFKEPLGSRGIAAGADVKIRTGCGPPSTPLISSDYVSSPALMETFPLLPGKLQCTWSSHEEISMRRRKNTKYFKCTNEYSNSHINDIDPTRPFYIHTRYILWNICFSISCHSPSRRVFFFLFLLLVLLPALLFLFSALAVLSDMSLNEDLFCCRSCRTHHRLISSWFHEDGTWLCCLLFDFFGCLLALIPTNNRLLQHAVILIFSSINKTAIKVIY